MSVATVPSVADIPLDLVELRSRRRDTVLESMVAGIRPPDVLRDARLCLATLLRREHLGCTAVGKGVALPNARSLGMARACVRVGRSDRGVDWSAPDALPVHLVVLVLSPSEWSDESHVALLERFAAVLRLQRGRQRALEAADLEQLAPLFQGVPA